VILCIYHKNIICLDKKHSLVAEVPHASNLFPSTLCCFLRGKEGRATIDQNGRGASLMCQNFCLGIPHWENKMNSISWGAQDASSFWVLKVFEQSLLCWTGRCPCLFPCHGLFEFKIRSCQEQMNSLELSSIHINQDFETCCNWNLLKLSTTHLNWPGN